MYDSNSECYLVSPFKEEGLRVKGQKPRKGISRSSGHKPFNYGLQQNKLHYQQEVEGFVKGEDIVLIMEGDEESLVHARSFTAYKPVDR